MGGVKSTSNLQHYFEKKKSKQIGCFIGTKFCRKKCKNKLFATGEFCLSLIIKIKIYKHLYNNECIFLIFFYYRKHFCHKIKLFEMQFWNMKPREINSNCFHVLYIKTRKIIDIHINDISYTYLLAMRTISSLLSPRHVKRRGLG